MNFKKEVSIVLGGAAGQGIQTIEEILTRVLKLSGYNVFATKEYMSRVRGGINTTEIIVSSEKVRAFVDRIDILIPFKKGVLDHLKERISDTTVVLGEKDNIDEDYLDNINLIEISLSNISQKLGNPIYINTIGSGMVVGLFDGDLEVFKKYLTEKFSSKGEEIVKKNIEAAVEGYNLGKSLSEQLSIEIEKTEDVKEEILLSGTEAVALGSAIGGCNFVSFYPMTPSTGVATFLAQKSEDLEILVEQVEDEIAAINMAIGSWYAGGRGMVTTSGGGFSLMCEGLSLAGMTESPVVVYLAQRPGPATGLPTRTAQGDLELALYSGHGEFPRIIYAPGKIEDAFYVSQLAFNMADKYQIPVFILSNEYFADTYYNIPDSELKRTKMEKHIVETEKNYKRYKLTENGISPRGIPKYGNGVVSITGNEHNELGDITEDKELSALMQEKRNKKLELMKKEALKPELIKYGNTTDPEENENYDYLVVGWGPTYYAIEGALKKLDRDDLAFLYFNQVYPISEDSIDYLKKAKKIICIEENYNAQFARLLRREFGIEADDKILKYNGRPFSVEELVEKLKEVLEG
ncbi:MAG: 2-oxoglutarate/2-oxoacid ferredoxin oxidoreductase subunit alpha [Methanothermococcus sp.]|uniref:2-oxoacid:acceptor oxidoreductase subunit alpha n=1 Tax=Methanothermococcus TaxID=155862 RepID=UPI000372225C|nr:MULTISPECIES: 2-oxoacid:acceptor oxidoreductase subunit alpha [Methanothermococcus]MDK2790056.1 2-oxoglutarate/2-oxoacid ferredoxin oxidoreductase subunit alpha [Methanothermococcus sp.]MDK2987107.1 2-oxoglutarate/2-oxoacid ferredoxin oxidoreductase subunit alpha [Methanothermococcus sp.]